MSNRLVTVGAVCLLIIAALYATITWQREQERREFVESFVISIYEGSDFAQEYLSDSVELNEMRQEMTREFDIVRMDHSGFQVRVYHIAFANGAEGDVYLEEQGRQIVGSAITIYPSRGD